MQAEAVVGLGMVPTVLHAFSARRSVGRAFPRGAGCMSFSIVFERLQAAKSVLCLLFRLQSYEVFPKVYSSLMAKMPFGQRFSLGEKARTEDICLHLQAKFWHFAVANAPQRASEK